MSPQFDLMLVKYPFKKFTIESHMLRVNSRSHQLCPASELPRGTCLNFVGNRKLDLLHHCLKHPNLLKYCVVATQSIQIIFMCACLKWSEQNRGLFLYYKGLQKNKNKTKTFFCCCQGCFGKEKEAQKGSPQANERDQKFIFWELIFSYNIFLFPVTWTC